MRGFRKVSAFCMGVANRLTNVCGDIFAPEYLRDMPGCSPLVWLGELQRKPLLKHRRFVQMEDAFQPFLLLPAIYAKLIIAIHLERMVNTKLFVTIPMPTGAESVAERARERDMEDPPEAEGGFQILLADLGDGVYDV